MNPPVAAKPVIFIVCISFLGALFLANVVSAQLTCTTKTSGCTSPEKEIFRISGSTNGHAELLGQTAYSTRVCCSASGLAGGSCDTGTRATLLYLSGPTNAHVEKTGLAQQSYPATNDVCLSADTGFAPECQYTTAACPAGYACVATISDNTNAHVAGCSTGAYPTKVCCRVTATSSPTTTVDPISSPTNDPTTRVTGTARSNSAATINDIKYEVTDPADPLQRAIPGWELKSIPAFTPSATVNFQFDIGPPLPEGTYIVDVVAFTSPTTSGTDSSSGFTVDLTPPVTTLTAIDGEPWSSGELIISSQQPIIAFDVIDELAGINPDTHPTSRIEYQVLNDETGAVVIPWTEIDIFPVPGGLDIPAGVLQEDLDFQLTTPLSEGITYQLQIRATDAALPAGNTEPVPNSGGTNVARFSRDGNPPTVTLIADPPEVIGCQPGETEGCDSSLTGVWQNTPAIADLLCEDAAASLLPNGNFDVDADGNGVPDSWTGNTGAVLSRDTATAVSGASLRFPATQNNVIAQSDFIPVSQTDVLTFSQFLKLDMTQGNFYVQVYLYDIDHNQIACCKTLSGGTFTSGLLSFTEKRYTIDMSQYDQSTRYIRVTYKWYRSTGVPNGTAWIDEALLLSSQDTGCDPASFRLKRSGSLYIGNGPACSTNYDEYTLTAPQTVDSEGYYCAAARDWAGNAGFTPQRLHFLVDQLAQLAWISAIDPAVDIDGNDWTNQPDFTVSWTATGSGSPISQYDVEYQITDPAGTTTPWMPWAVPALDTSASFGSGSPTTVQDGFIYTFHVRATDEAGNVGAFSAPRAVTVDLTAPTAMIEPLPASVPPTFTLDITGNDALSPRPSGVGSYEVEYTGDHPTAPDGICTLSYINEQGVIILMPPLTTFSDDEFFSLEVTGYDDCTYNINASAIDKAGNKGERSPDLTVTIDNQAPLIDITDVVNTETGESAFNFEPDYAFAWTTNASFELFWEAEDQPSGSASTVCVDVEYQVTSALGIEQDWTTWITCADASSAQFGVDEDGDGLGDPFPITHGFTYHFRLTATDEAGNQAVLDPPEEIAIDTVLPAVTMEAEDSAGKELAVVEQRKNVVSPVTVTTSAEELGTSESGLLSHQINYWLTQNNVRIFRSVNCLEPPAVPSDVYGNPILQSLDCPADISLDEAAELEYWVSARDLAGNRNSTRHQFVINHSIANFVVHDLNIIVGESPLVKMEVRNINEEDADVITVNLTGDIIGEFLPEEIAILGGTITTDNKNIQLPLDPLTQTVVHVRVTSAEPLPAGGFYTLRLGAFNQDATLVDSDTMRITIAYNPAFDAGLSRILLFLLLAAIAVSYYLFHMPHRRTSRQR